MLQFNNNHIFTGYLKQFLSSFNLPTCKVYTAEFEKFYAEHGREHPKVIESNDIIKVSESTIRPAVGITYLKDGSAQQYFWDTREWNARQNLDQNKVVKYWKSNQILHYNGNKVLGLTKTLKNPTALYNYQTHEYLGDYLRFLRDFENINLMSMYNCFSNRLCNNIKFGFELDSTPDKTITINSYDTSYKIYMLPVKLFENYTIAIDCYSGVELFCGFYNEKLDTSVRAMDLIKRTYQKVPKALFNQPFVYDKLNVVHWNWEAENTVTRVTTDNTADGRKANTKTPMSTMYNMDKLLRSEVAMRESELKLFIKVPTTVISSIVVLEGDYRNFNDSIYSVDSTKGWQYLSNSAIVNFDIKNCKDCKEYKTCIHKTEKTCKNYSLPDLNSREFRPISKLQLLALNTGVSYPFADRLIEYLVANVILPNDPTPDNIIRLQKVMEDCGYGFQIEGIWEPKMQMILYDYLMNSGKFVAKQATDAEGQPLFDEATGKPIYKVQNLRKGVLKQTGQKNRSDFYDILGYADKDAEKLYASWKIQTVEKNGKETHQVTAKTTLENVDIYSNLYNN